MRAGWKDTKKVIVGCFVAATLTALMGIFPAGVSAAGPTQTWSVFVHIDYPDGFFYEGTVAVGVRASELQSVLRECGRSHRGGSAVRYHCFPVAE
jgi:hypothetical protein